LIISPWFSSTCFLNAIIPFFLKYETKPFLNCHLCSITTQFICQL
jgi:hypothetical protein